MKKIIQVITFCALILGFNAMAIGGGAFGGTSSLVVHNNFTVAIGGGAFGGTT